MGATTSVAIGPVPSGLKGFGGQSILRSAGISATLIPFTAKMSASYSTGGDTIAMPSAEIAGRDIVWMSISPNKYGANWYTWNGSQTAPKIQVWSAFNTELTAATDLSAVTVTGLMLLAG
jgi:hypothetical protein